MGDRSYDGEEERRLKTLWGFRTAPGSGNIFVLRAENAPAPTHRSPARFKSDGPAGPSDATPERGYEAVTTELS
mgnify:CR=1 FL=1